MCTRRGGSGRDGVSRGGCGVGRGWWRPVCGRLRLPSDDAAPPHGHRGSHVITWLWLLGGVVVIVGAVAVGKPRWRRAAVRSMRRRVRRTPVGRGARTARPGGRAAPITSGAQRVGRRPVFGATRCTAACRMSRKPAFDKHNRLTCDCPCKGREHGKYRSGSSASLRGAAGRSAVRLASRPPAAPRPPATPPSPPPSSSPGRPAVVTPRHGSADGPVYSPTADRGWKSLTGPSRQSMSAHAKTSPRCVGGSVSARTFRDNRTDPPTITQQLTCDTCRADL